MSRTTKQIISLTDIYLARKLLAESTVSRLATGSWDAISRIRQGKEVTTKRAEKIIFWFSFNWPADLAWPDYISRPDVKKDAA